MIKLFRAIFSSALSIGAQKSGALERLGLLSGRPSASADARQWLLRLLVPPLLLTAATGHAAAVNFNGSTIQGCTLSETKKIYNCTSQPGFGAIGIAAGYSVIGDLVGASAVLTGNAKLNGNLNVVGTVTMGSYASITGSVTAGETVTMAASSTVGESVRGTTVTMAASGYIAGNVTGTTVTLAANSAIGASVLEATTVTVAASGCVRGDVNGTTVTLAADAGIVGNVNAATTVTLAAKASVGGNVVAGTTFTSATGSTVGGTVTIAGAVPFTIAGYQQSVTSCQPIPSVAVSPATIKSREWRQLFMR